MEARCPVCGAVLSVWEEVFGENHDSSKCVAHDSDADLMKEGYEVMAEENRAFARMIRGDCES